MIAIDAYVACLYGVGGAAPGEGLREEQPISRS
jgi:hypothetical protein